MFIISSNNAVETAGGLEFSSDSKITIMYTALASNTAASGGAVYVDASSKTVVVSCKFLTNVATSGNDVSVLMEGQLFGYSSCQDGLCIVGTGSADVVTIG